MIGWCWLEVDYKFFITICILQICISIAEILIAPEFVETFEDMVSAKCMVFMLQYKNKIHHL